MTKSEKEKREREGKSERKIKERQLINSRNQATFVSHTLLAKDDESTVNTCCLCMWPKGRTN